MLPGWQGNEESEGRAAAGGEGDAGGLALLQPNLRTVVEGRTKAAGLPLGFSKAHTQPLSDR